MNEYIYDCVCDWINNEIIYIENEVDFRDGSINEAAYKEDLQYLKTLSSDKIQEITSKVMDDDELYNKINETIHYYLYH
ncbi:MAG: hypothetical protein IJH55_01145 [Romboutsia sp.]|nr:hypothetical protein [Romboutsia sp.]